jgi:hypothetical protein
MTLPTKLYSDLFSFAISTPLCHAEPVNPLGAPAKRL